jgi:hypothetical protein
MRGEHRNDYTPSIRSRSIVHPSPEHDLVVHSTAVSCDARLPIGPHSRQAISTHRCRLPRGAVPRHGHADRLGRLQHAPIRDLQRIPVGPITRAPLNDDHDAPGAVETGPRVSGGTRRDGCCRRDQQGQGRGFEKPCHGLLRWLEMSMLIGALAARLASDWPWRTVRLVPCSKP